MSEFFSAFDKEFQIKQLDRTNPLNAKVIIFFFIQSVFIFDFFSVSFYRRLCFIEGDHLTF